MDRTRAAARRRAVAAGAALFAIATGGAAHAAVSLQATSTQVSSPGGTARVCVMLSSDEPVAGVQTDIRWDGNCATLASKSQCVPAGSHGKDVHADTDKQPDFTVKVLVLSLSNVDAIPDGPVFCCDFQGEAEPGSCCSLSLINAGASDPGGKAIPVNTGRPASICTSGSGNQPGRGFSSPSGQGPLSASNAPIPGEGGGAAPPAQAPAAQPGGGRAPAAQVLPGGGAQVQNPPDAAVVPPTAPAVQLPTAAAAAATAAAAMLTPQVPRPPLAPPTAAATSAPTQAAVAPTPADTPVTRPTAAAAATKATVAPTKPAAAKQQAAAPPAQATEERGWFGCQIEAGASAGPVLGLGLLALLGAIVRRRRR